VERDAGGVSAEGLSGAVSRDTTPVARSLANRLPPRWSIRARLRLLVLGVALPLLLIGSYEVVIEVRKEKRRIEETAQALARMTAAHAEQLVVEAEWMLSGIAERPLLRESASGRCDPLFAHFRDVHPRFQNLVLFDAGGRRVCSALEMPRRHAVPEAALKVVRQASAEGKLIVGAAHQSAATGEWVTLVAHPAQDGAGDASGVLGLAISLKHFHPFAGSSAVGPPEGAYFALLDGQGAVVARSRDSDATVGRNFRHVAVVQDMLAQREGILRAADKDGVERLIGFLPVAGTDWIALASLPTDRLAADLAWVAAEHAGFVLATLALVAFFAWRTARGITLPVERMAAAARAIEQGSGRRRLPVGGPDEIAHVARQLNRTLDALAEREDQLRALSATLEQRVAARTIELERANAELESFSCSVSHDLHAPLRALNGFAGILAQEERETLSPNGRALLDRIAHNAVRMGALIDDLLQFSRLGREALRRTEVDLCALAQSVADELREPYPETRVSVAALPVVSGDAAMLRQVFANLIGNALKYSAGREDARVEVGVEVHGDGQAIFIRDNGAGFDMRHAGKLFGVFQRLHKESEFPGTGVGLAIVKRVIERHGGRVWAESAPGAGACFRFTLA
jgi:signal transduction histidine kinase